MEHKECTDVEPEGFRFVGRFPNKPKEGHIYTKMVITDDDRLVCLCKDGYWHTFRKATAEDRKIAATCFRTIEELMAWHGELMFCG